MSGRGIATANALAAAMTDEQSGRYGALMGAITAHAAAFTRDGLSAGDAARVITKAVTARRPRTRYTTGRDAAVLTRLSRLMPDRVLDRLLAGELRPDYRTITAS